MPIKARCPSCEHPYELHETLRGKTVRCKRCEETFVVGKTKPKADDEDDYDDEEPDAREARVPRDGRPRSRAALRDDDGPPRRKRRPADDDEDDYDDEPRPRRRKKAGGAPVGLVVGGVIGGCVLFVVVIGVVVWLAFSRRSAPGAANPGGPPPGINPGGGGGQAAAGNENLVTLSNPRRGGGFGIRRGFQLDYRFSGAAPRFGAHYRLAIKTADGDTGHADLHGIVDQQGTISIREFGIGGGLQGRVEMHLEQSSIPGRFGNWQRVSNTVTLN